MHAACGLRRLFFSFLSFLSTLPSQQLQLHIRPNGHGPTNAINRAKLAGVLVALQQLVEGLIEGRTDTAVP
eukprot:804550-Pelagomonas_calceolata.AAC.1